MSEANQGSVRQLSHFIDGQHAAGASGQFVDVMDPALGRVTGHLPVANTDEVDDAVAAAKAAFPAWSENAPLKRARLMFKFKELLEAHSDELAELITRDHGKLFEDAKGEVIRGIEIVEFACGIPNLLKTDFTDQSAPGIDAWIKAGSQGEMTLPSITGIAMGWYAAGFVAFLLFAAWGMGKLEHMFAYLRPRG